MAVGGLFFDSEPFRTASGASRGATGETSRTGPERDRRRADAGTARQPTRRRRNGGPSAWSRPTGPGRRPRRRPVGVVALRGARKASGRVSRLPLRHRRDARVRRRATPKLWRHSPMNLTARQFTPAIDAAFYRLDSTLYQLQLSFHTHSTEPEPTVRARTTSTRGGT